MRSRQIEQYYFDFYEQLKEYATRPEHSPEFSYSRHRFRKLNPQGGRIEGNRSVPAGDGHLLLQYSLAPSDVKVAVYLTRIELDEDARPERLERARQLLDGATSEIGRAVNCRTAWDLTKGKQPYRFYILVPVPGEDLSNKDVWDTLIPRLVNAMDHLEKSVLLVQDNL